MLLFLFCLCCVLQMFHYMSVFGKREPSQRFIIENGVKQALFGSYSYDPIREVFEPPIDNDTQSLSNHPSTSAFTVSTSEIHSTALTDNTSSLDPSRHFKKRATFWTTKSALRLDKSMPYIKNNTVKVQKF